MVSSATALKGIQSLNFYPIGIYRGISCGGCCASGIKWQGASAQIYAAKVSKYTTAIVVECMAKIPFINNANGIEKQTNFEVKLYIASAIEKNEYELQMYVNTR